MISSAWDTSHGEVWCVPYVPVYMRDRIQFLASEVLLLSVYTYLYKWAFSLGEGGLYLQNYGKRVISNYRIVCMITTILPSVY